MTHSKQDSLIRYNALVDKAVLACRQYYGEDNNSELTDPQYDALIAEIEELELELPERFHRTDCPIRDVGTKISGFLFAPMSHYVPMLSLDKGHNRDDVMRFDKRVCKALDTNKVMYSLERKYDGLGLDLIYIADRNTLTATLKSAITRGDGLVGEDVTVNAALTNDVPTMISFPASLLSNMGNLLSIRGEVVMANEAFIILNEELKAAGEKPYATARHAAAGSLRQLDPEITSQRPISFIAYHLIEAVGCQNDALDVLEDMGFKTQPIRYLSNDIDGIMDIISAEEEDRHNRDIGIDGIVIKVDDFSDQQVLGATSHHPRWALAYKFKAECGVSSVTDVFFSMGKHGTLTPVLKIIPVMIGGVRIDSITLHNVDELERLQVAVGSAVELERAGDAIPNLLGVQTQDSDLSHAITGPSDCPYCGKPTYKTGPKLYCGNRGCDARVMKQTVHFASRGAMDIRGLGEETIRQLVMTGAVDRPMDVLFLQQGDFVSHGCSRLEADKLRRATADSISKALREEWRFIYGICIQGIGIETAKELIGKFGNIANLRLLSAKAIAASKILPFETAERLVAALKDDDRF